MQATKLKRNVTSTCAALSLSLALTAQASVVEVEVPGTAGPWDWVSGGLNAGKQFGVHDFTDPVTVDLAALGIDAGEDVYVFYRSGTTSAYPAWGAVDQNGYVNTPYDEYKDDYIAVGSTANPFPSYYMPGWWGEILSPANPDPFGVFLQSLVGALTATDGSVIFAFPVGPVTPFNQQQSMGYGISFSVPANGALLQLGFNDDKFADNTGSMQVCIGSSSDEVEACRIFGVETPDGEPTSADPEPANAVPEPGTLALLGVALAAGALRRRHALPMA